MTTTIRQLIEGVNNEWVFYKKIKQDGEFVKCQEI